MSSARLIPQTSNGQISNEGNSNARLGTNHTRVTHQTPVLPSSIDETGRIRTSELLKSMDIAACMSAERHCNHTSVTLSMDDVNFSDAKAKVGDAIIIRSRVNRVWNTSMEVGLRVEIESPESGNTRHLCSSYFVFVALDDKGMKTKVPGLIPMTDREKVRWALADDRRRIRMDRTKLVDDTATVANAFTKSPQGSHLRYSVGPNKADDANNSTERERAMKRMSTLLLTPRGVGGGGGGSEMDEERNEVTHMVMPQHCNHYGNTFGGIILMWAHECCEVASARHARAPVVTVSVDDVFFLAPSSTGTRIVLKASVNRVFNRSMEVGVRVEGHFLNGDIVLINRAYFTMVALPPSTTMSATAITALQPSIAPLSKNSDVGKKKGLFGSRKTSETSMKSPAQPTPPPAPLVQAKSNNNVSVNSEYVLRSVPLNTPDQIRRHQQALGRRRVRLERLQLRRSNHLAWPFTPDTDPRTFILENLITLEHVTMDGEGEQEAWGLMSETQGVQCWSKVDMRVGVSMKTTCLVKFKMESVIAAITAAETRCKWDKVVTGYEVRHTFTGLNADVVWLATDMRPFNPTSHPTDFALLRTWKGSAQDGTYVIASHSIVHHTVPATKNAIRAEVGSSGFVLVQQPKGVQVTYVVQLNPQGTSIVASELDGSSVVFRARMQGLVSYLEATYPHDVVVGEHDNNNSDVGGENGGAQHDNVAKCVLS